MGSDNANSSKVGVVADRFTLHAEDEHQVLVDCWQPQPARTPQGVIQILHGLGEHAARYERFAQACVAAGLVVAAHNHRGHGESCPPDHRSHYADADGWNKVISDVLIVRRRLLQQFPEKPIVVLGHSMGSYIAQCSVMRDPQDVAALILSASTYASRLQLTAGRLLARFESMRKGVRQKSALLNKMGFGDFNDRFAPNRSEFDWLSRDDDEVDKYIADPACGGHFSNRLWFDLIGGLQEITSRKSLRRIPAGLPMLIMGGQRDPVGGQAGLTTLAMKYRSTNHSNITLRIYEGGRHEMLNETNRDEVTADVVRWVGEHLL